MTRLIRDAGPGDVPVLQDLYRHLIPEEDPAPTALAEARLEALYAFPGSGVLMAFDGAVAVASVTLIVVPNMTRQGAPYAFIENVVTHSAHRRKGHAQALLSEAEDRAWTAGCYRIMIVSGNHNTGAHGFYSSAGYAGSKTGFQKRRIPDRASRG
ncbi:MAG: GNAT family N-acetyltransferase [Pseudomonadota bacterium]